MSELIRPVLVTDFDGTLTRFDFYEVLIDSVFPADVPDFWGDLRSGKRTLFETLRDIFAFVPVGEETLIALCRRAGLDGHLAESVAALRAAGWEIEIVSAGCCWYIERILAEAGVEIPINANPGEVDDEGRLRMRPPVDSPYYVPELGINKAALVRARLADGRTVAYAGDGPPDLEAALLIPESLRFAKGDLAKRLTGRGAIYIPFDRWSEVAERLLTDTGQAYRNR